MANSFLLIPVWLLHAGVRPHLLALEAAVLTGLFLCLPTARSTRVLAWIAATLVVTASVLLLGDTTARMSLARPLNLYLDLQLLSAVANLLRGTLGAILGPVVLVLGPGLAVATVVLLARLFAALSPARDNRRAGRVGAAVLAVSLLAIPIRWTHPVGVVLGLPAIQMVREQVRHVSSMMKENDRFAQEMATTPDRYGERPGHLERLEGRDVLLAFIESYGVSAVDDPRYAPTVRPRLETMAADFEREGLHVVTGHLVAPSQGGMSWLGHGSVLSGLWLENQLRYDLLLASDRQSLVDDFEAAGYRTVALMPAITLAWPEGDRLGYDRIYARDDIDYAGPPLNWVTMPDQFTWSFLQRTIREENEGPLFAEIGLISSHAPWTPILPVLDDWDTIGDGRVFDRFADAGETPEQLWRDSDRVREHYALAVGYALDAFASYATEYLDDRTLLIALGDHQPAPLITGEDASRAVPVHVVARNPDVLQPFLEWGFVEGTMASGPTVPHRMDAFRDWFVRAYSSDPSVVERP